MEARRALLTEVSKEAGACLRRYFDTDVAVYKKQGELDLVTEADQNTERLIVDAITKTFPQDAIIAEEGGSKEGSGGFQWIIDPLDGTTNFAHTLPQFCVSIALAHQGEIVSGVVYDPIKEEYFEAHKGQGATLNGKPISVANRQELGEALGVTGFSYDRRTRMDELLDRARRILMHCQGFRRLGSAALDLAYIACGRYDVFLEDGLNAWDIAAGQLLVAEAGGVVSLLNGSPLDVHAGQVMAANPHLHPQALEHLVAR